MIKGSGSGFIPLTSGSGSGRPKNTWIRWIRIREAKSTWIRWIRIRIRNTARFKIVVPDPQDCLFELLEEAAEFLSGSRTALAFPRWLPALRDVILFSEL
jgi:hypothetical protein